MTAFFTRWIFAPLAVCLFVLAPTRAMLIAVVDGPSARYTGFPLPWRADLHISSGASEIYLGPLVIDLAVYALLAAGLVQIWRRWTLLSGPIMSSAMGAIVWLAGAGLLILSIAIVSILDTFYKPWYDPGIWDRVISTGWSRFD